jgi:hypothetical protein
MTSLTYLHCVAAISLLLGACGTTPHMDNDSRRRISNPDCEPLPCPEGAPWSSEECACVRQDDGLNGGEDSGTTQVSRAGCEPLPCPEGAPWSQSACACVREKNSESN